MINDLFSLKAMPLSATDYQSQTQPSSRPLLFWLAAVLLTVWFCSLILAAPLAQTAGHDRVAQTLYRSFGILCHQLPERSYFIAGHKLAVCSRCTGIYAGFLLTLLCYPVIRSIRSVEVPARRWLFLFSLPLLIDFSLGFLGIWKNTHSSRFITGFLFGGMVVFYLVPALAELSQWKRVNTPNPSKPTFTLASPEAIANAPSDYRKK
jgi:uncharacterized membrane protein